MNDIKFIIRMVLPTKISTLLEDFGNFGKLPVEIQQFNLCGNRYDCWGWCNKNHMKEISDIASRNDCWAEFVDEYRKGQAYGN
jgi:hypothetical protein